MRARAIGKSGLFFIAAVSAAVVAAFALAGCGKDDGDKEEEPVYTVTYDGNGNTGGKAPVDNNSYKNDATVAVMGAGDLKRAGYTFSNWNAAANGSGRTYEVAEKFEIKDDVKLYAQWILVDSSAYAVTYYGNGNTGGDAPEDPKSPYISGSEVTVLGKGDLAKTDSVFTGWNTSADGSGTSYKTGARFSISKDMNLYAQWNTFSAEAGVLEWFATDAEKLPDNVTFKTIPGGTVLIFMTGVNQVERIPIAGGFTEVFEDSMYLDEHNYGNCRTSAQIKVAEGIEETIDLSFFGQKRTDLRSVFIAVSFDEQWQVEHFFNKWEPNENKSTSPGSTTEMTVEREADGARILYFNQVHFAFNGANYHSNMTPNDDALRIWTEDMQVWNKMWYIQSDEIGARTFTVPLSAYGGRKYGRMRVVGLKLFK
jgi:uncharacterized repeat protein (TIGR02543 family)